MRLQRRIKVDDNGCWLWTGFVDKKGYGHLGDYLTHRLAFELFIGPLPPGVPLDHQCAVKRCCNPLHLQPTTSAENSRRKAWKDQCPQGHRLPPNAPVHHEQRVCLLCG